MLKISKLADYGTVIMDAITRSNGDVLSAKNLSQSTGVNLPTVSKLLKILHDSGLVMAQRGASGGYSLARSPETITVADVVAAIEGWPALTECAGQIDCCAQTDQCGVKDNWQLINQVIMTALRSVSLADMTKPLHYHPLIEHGISLQPQIKVTVES